MSGQWKLAHASSGSCSCFGILIRRTDLSEKLEGPPLRLACSGICTPSNGGRRRLRATASAASNLRAAKTVHHHLHRQGPTQQMQGLDGRTAWLAAYASVGRPVISNFCQPATLATPATSCLKRLLRPFPWCWVLGASSCPAHMDGWQNVVSSVALTDLLVRYARPLSAQCAWYPLAQRSASEAGAMLCAVLCWHCKLSRA